MMMIVVLGFYSTTVPVAKHSTINRISVQCGWCTVKQDDTRKREDSELNLTMSSMSNLDMNEGAEDAVKRRKSQAQAVNDTKAQVVMVSCFVFLFLYVEKKNCSRGR